MRETRDWSARFGVKMNLLPQPKIETQFFSHNKTNEMHQILRFILE
jgi:hypothetical protein